MIDLRSDTLTKPDDEMLKTIMTAALGDSGRLDENSRGGDPTVNELEDYAAELLGKEAAAFLCSGTMGNSAALLTWLKPGDRALIDRENHTYRTEQFVFERRFGQVVPVFYETDHNGLPLLESVKSKLETENVKLLQLENTHNAHGGLCIPIELHRKLYEAACEHKVKVHLDGARLFNAAVALNIPVSEIARYTDSVMFCVSKGIGAPFGSLVCGEKPFIDELRNTQKRLGGGMRQAGIMAAQALYAMKNLTERLKEDHMHARKTADGLKGLRYVHPQETIETNIVMLKVMGMDAGEYCQRLKESGVFTGEVTDNRIRLVFYRGITDKDVEDTVSIIRALDESLCEIK